MARYWVGGTGNWSDTAHWAASSNGAGGETVPTSSDDVYFDGYSGTGTCTVNSGATRACKGLDCSNYTGGLTLGTSLNVYESFKLVSGMTFTHGNRSIAFQTVTGSFTADFGGKSLYSFEKRGNGTLTLSSALTSTAWWGLYAGELDMNDYDVTSVMLYCSAGTLRMGSGTFTVTASDPKGAVVAIQDATLYAETSTIKLTDTTSSTKTISTKGQVINILELVGGGTGTFIIQREAPYAGTTTINDLYVNPGSNAMTINFEYGATFDLGDLRATGSAGKLIKLYSTSAGHQYTLTTDNAQISCDYLDLKDSNATEADTWYAGTHSNDTSNNDGWVFDEPFTAYTKTFDEVVNTSEAYTRGATFHRTYDEAVNTSEVFSIGKAFQRIFSEVVNASEVLNKLSGYNKTFSEVVNASESLTRQSGYSRTLSDEVEASETISKGMGKNIAEIINTSETFSRKVEFHPTYNENVSITEKLRRYLNGIEIIWSDVAKAVTSWADESHGSTTWHDQTNSTIDTEDGVVITTENSVELKVEKNKTTWTDQ